MDAGSRVTQEQLPMPAWMQVIRVTQEQLPMPTWMQVIRVTQEQLPMPTWMQVIRVTQEQLPGPTARACPMSAASALGISCKPLTVLGHAETLQG